jgi:hypothetical protein
MTKRIRSNPATLPTPPAPAAAPTSTRRMYHGVRRVPKIRYEKIDADFNALLKEIDNLETEIVGIEDILKTAKRPALVEHSGGKKTIPIMPIEAKSYKNQLTEKRSELKLKKTELQTKGYVFQNASSKNAKSTKEKVRRIYERRRLASKGVRKMDDIKAIVNQVVNVLTTNNDVRIGVLKANAIDDGRKFYSEFQKLLRNEVKDPNIKAMIVASSKVKTGLSNMIREKYGWVKIIKK